MRRRWFLGLAVGVGLLAAALLGWIAFDSNRPIELRDANGQIVATLPPLLEHHLDSPDKDDEIPQLDGVLNALVRDYARLGPEAMDLVPLAGPTGNTVAVSFWMQSGPEILTALADLLHQRGIELLHQDSETLEAFVPIAQLAEIAQLPPVAHMQAIVPPTVQQVSAVTPAVSAHNAAAWHGAGFTGKGIKVGIIDAGFFGYNSAAQAGEVPLPIAALCFRRTTINPERVRETEVWNCPYQNTLTDKHGTAVAEAVVDVAPEADLYLAAPLSQGDLKYAVQWMVDQRVDIINYSMAWIWDGPGDGTSPYPLSPLATAEYAIQNGVTWINSAGNHNRATWFGELDNNLTHWFLVDLRRLDRAEPRFYDHIFFRSSLWSRGRVCTTVILAKPQALVIQLRWDDIWPGAQRDLDVHLYDSQGVRVDTSQGRARQAGGPFDRPLELVFTPTLVPGTYCLAVHDYSAAQGGISPTKPWLQLQVFKGPEMVSSSYGRSISNPAESANPGLLAVGAAPHTADNSIEDFSSRGPTMDGRIKPDVVGVDQVPATVYQADFDQGAFAGTSQAAPHVAGLAALVKQRFPEYTPAEVTNYLKFHADPRLDPPPHDTTPNAVWGQGLAQLPPLTPNSTVVSPLATPELSPVAATPAPTVVATAGQPCPAKGQSPSLECDKQILLAVRDTLRGSNTEALRYWQASAPVREFGYVLVAKEPPRVTELFLGSEGLSGTIPPELGQLSQLQRLDLGSNDLTGPIPPELGQLSQLQRLDLSSNDLTGPISPEVGQLSQLWSLSLNSNQLTGSIPPELGQLSQLQRLDLGSNDLTGPIPPELGQLSQLWSLSLNSNQLTGSIPPELGQLSQLQRLDLGSNDLTEPIPPELGQLSQLQRLDLSSNDLTGPISPEVGQLSQLWSLSLNYNQLTGSIPPELGQLSQLYELWLSDNLLTGFIPPELGQLSQLQMLLLDSNQLTGPVPRELENLNLLQVAHLEMKHLFKEYSPPVQ